MSILEEIVVNKRLEVSRSKELIPLAKLKSSLYFLSPTVSLIKYVSRKDKNGIIAEIKRSSPSKGNINPHLSVENISIGYMQAGASALSILTDKKYFSGSLEDLETARRYNFCPILRKDFIVDEYQIYEARSFGADAILLIASILEKDEILRFYNLARELSLEVLFEVHTVEELKKLPTSLDGLLIGVNNRNLDNLTEKLEVSTKLIKELPKDLIKVAESSIKTPEQLLELRKIGYQGFLIGEAFLSKPDPALECARFVTEIKNAKS